MRLCLICLALLLSGTALFSQDTEKVLTTDEGKRAYFDSLFVEGYDGFKNSVQRIFRSPQVRFDYLAGRTTMILEINPESLPRVKVYQPKGNLLPAVAWELAIRRTFSRMTVKNKELPPKKIFLGLSYATGDENFTEEGDFAVMCLCVMREPKNISYSIIEESGNKRKKRRKTKN